MPGEVIAKTLLLAEDECRKAGSFFVGTEHLFLAIAADPTPEVETKLLEHDLNLDTAVACVRQLIRRWDPGDAWNGLLQQTPRVRRIADNAYSLADPDEPQPHHFLQALISESKSHTARALLDKERKPIVQRSPPPSPTAKADPPLDLTFEPAKDQADFGKQRRSSPSVRSAVRQGSDRTGETEETRTQRSTPARIETDHSHSIASNQTERVADRRTGDG